MSLEARGQLTIFWFLLKQKLCDKKGVFQKKKNYLNLKSTIKQEVKDVLKST